MSKHLTRRDLIKVGGGAGLAIAGAAAAPTHAFAADQSLPQVPRRVLGKTGKSIPILLFGGAVKLDRRFDPKMAEALRFGVNYYDAADCYGGGTCEAAVGNFQTRARVRKKIWITSKSDAHDPAGFERTVNNSLKELKTDYIDLYYLHALNDPSRINASLEKVVAKLKKQGKILHFGFSCHDGNVAELLQLAAKTPWVESVMFRFDFGRYGDKTLNAAIDAAHKAGVGLIAMKTQKSSVSFGDAVKKFERTGKWNKYQSALKAVWADRRITAAVSHMPNMQILRENIKAALDKTELGAVELDALERYAQATRSLTCDGCDHICNPAVDAPVQIGNTMRFLMYHDVYGEPEKARELFGKLPEAARQLGNIDFAPANRACPHGVDVAWHMKRASEVLV
ncbi:MAG: aldo/keto reductase [Myxococcota bacterium]